jgi:GNAT superfamily N-acetyltransferase
MTARHLMHGGLTAADIEIVKAGLRATDPADVGPRQYRELNIGLRASEKELVGAVMAGIAWDWLMIDRLWVHKSLRRQGLGSQLLVEVERKAVAMGCKHARVDTFDFQARGFYERNGYVAYAQLAGFPRQHSFLHMSKTLGS